MKQFKLVQMALESEMSPEEIAVFRKQITLKYVTIQSRFDDCESEIEKAAFLIALVMACEKLCE